MITNHDPTNHIIELAENTFDPHQPPTPDQAQDILNEDNLTGDFPLAMSIAAIGTINVTDITYQDGAWFVEYHTEGE